MTYVIIKTSNKKGTYQYLSETFPYIELSPNVEDALVMSLQQAHLLAYSLREARLRHYFIRVSNPKFEALRAKITA